MQKLTPEQSERVTALFPTVRKIVEARFPVDNFRRDDAMSDAYLALCCAIQSYRGEPDGFLPYLRTAIGNAVKRSGRREAKHSHEEYPADIASREPGPLEKTLEREAKEIIDKRTAEMSFDDKVALSMKTLGYDAVDIAAELRKPVSTVRHRLRKARDAFEQLFSEKT